MTTRTNTLVGLIATALAAAGVAVATAPATDADASGTSAVATADDRARVWDLNRTQEQGYTVNGELFDPYRVFTGTDADDLVCDPAGGQAIDVVHMSSSNADLADDAFIREELVSAQRIFERSAGRHGADVARVPRFEHDGTCTAAVDAYVVSAARQADVFDIEAEVAARGHEGVVLVFAHDYPACGVALTNFQTSTGPGSHPSDEPSLLATAVVGPTCFTEDGTVAHEVLHALGVADGTPNQVSSGPDAGTSHVEDGHDVMAYSDEFEGFRDTDCSWRPRAVLLDCNGDDYFHPSPPSGSYLASAWNVWDSDWLFETPIDATLRGGGFVDRLPARTDRVATSVVDTTALCAPYVSDPSTAFPDLGGPLEDFVRCAAGLGIVNGFTDGTFRGDVRLTREQVAAFTARTLRAAGGDYAGAGQDVYVDDDGSVFEDDLDALAVAGIPVTAVGDPYWWRDGERFELRPRAIVTRSEMAAWVSGGLMDLLGPSVHWRTDWAFGDVFVDDEGDDHEPFVNHAASSGVVQGIGVGPDGPEYGPDRPVTRGQMAVFAVRMLVAAGA